LLACPRGVRVGLLQTLPWPLAPELDQDDRCRPGAVDLDGVTGHRDDTLYEGAAAGLRRHDDVPALGRPVVHPHLIDEQGVAVLDGGRHAYTVHASGEEGADEREDGADDGRNQQTVTQASDQQATAVTLALCSVSWLAEPESAIMLTALKVPVPEPSGGEVGGADG